MKLGKLGNDLFEKFVKTLDDKYWEMIDAMRLSQLRELDD